MSTNYYRGRQRRPQPSGPRPNKFAGECRYCGKEVPAGSGLLTGTRESGYEVQHSPEKWQGSPVSGGYAGGCPKAPADSAGTPVAIGDAVRTLHNGTAGVPPEGTITRISADGRWAVVTGGKDHAAVPLAMTVVTTS